MTSQWASRRLKSPASGLFAQLFVQVQIKENIKVPPHWPLWGEPPVTGGFPSQRASNTKNFDDVIIKHFISSLKHRHLVRAMFCPKPRSDKHSMKHPSITVKLISQVMIYLFMLDVRKRKTWYTNVIGFSLSKDNLHVWRSKKVAVQCPYNAVNFLPNQNKIHPITRPLGRGMGCILVVQTVIHTLPQSLQWCVQYHLILYHVITTLDCIGTAMHTCISIVRAILYTW